MPERRVEIAAGRYQGWGDAVIFEACNLDNNPALSAPRPAVRDKRWGPALPALVVPKWSPTTSYLVLRPSASQQLRAYFLQSG